MTTLSLSEERRRGYVGRLGKFAVWKKKRPRNGISVVRWARVKKLMTSREYKKFRSQYYKYPEGAYFWDIEEFLREG